MQTEKSAGTSRASAFREQVASCLREQDFHGLLAAGKPMALVRALFSLLYSPDELIHWRAVEALGRVAATLADEKPEAGRDILRRLFWALNDESGGNGRAVPEAIGAIISRRPALYGDLTSVLLSFLGDPALRRCILWAAAEIGWAAPALIRGAAPAIVPCLTDEDPHVRAHAVRALGEIGGRPAPEIVARLQKDEAAAEIYLDGELKKVRVKEMADRYFGDSGGLPGENGGR
ncbi:MAG: DVU0298 family protein [Bacillota bacterium]